VIEVCRHHVPVRHHHALGQPGRSGRVDQHCQIEIDAGTARPSAAGERRIERKRVLKPADGTARDEGERERARRCGFRHRDQALLGDEGSRAAMVEHIGELSRLGGRMDRAEHGSRLEGREDADHRLPAVFHEDGHSIAAAHSAALERSGEAIGQLVELPIGQARVCDHQGDLVAKVPRARSEELLYAHYCSPYAAQDAAASLRRT